MGCGCGKRTVQRSGAVNTVNLQQNSSQLQAAQTYQSVTIQSAPQAPVTTRKTV